MNKPTVNQLVTKHNTCRFDHLRQGYAFYNILDDSTGKVIEYTFPIPLNDIGTATLNDIEKSITLMRWIRKAVDNNELVIKQRGYAE